MVAPVQQPSGETRGDTRAGVRSPGAMTPATAVAPREPSAVVSSAPVSGATGVRPRRLPTTVRPAGAGPASPATGSSTTTDAPTPTGPGPTASPSVPSETPSPSP